MSQVFNKENGKLTPVTILDVSDNVIAKVLTDGENITHMEIGAGKQKNSNNADKNNYKELDNVPFTRRVLKVKNSEEFEVGKEINADIFVEGDLVDVIGISKGKGFAGVMKRWNYKGGKATHGQSDRDRAPGSIGSGTTIGRVFKGKKMPGRMGRDKVTVKRLKIMQIDKENNLVAVSGAVPGTRGTYVLVKESYFNK